jgi:hypothetical protein
VAAQEAAEVIVAVAVQEVVAEDQEAAEAEDDPQQI